VSAPTLVRAARDPARGGRVGELRELSRTTPGALVLFTAGVVLASVLVGLLTAMSVQSRARSLDDLATASGPLSDAAQSLYRSLSDADATATSAFLSGGLERPEVRARYLSGIARAETALATAVAAREPADLVDPASPLSVLSRELSVYTGLVETARANNQQGFPVGAAYQREASSLMRDTLLPAAHDLYTSETAALRANQDQAGALPLGELLLGLAMLVVLYVAQRYVRRHSRRRLNVGLAVATGAAVVSLAWVLLASAGVLVNVDASRDQGSAQTEVLAKARILALTARGDETLTLVARGSGQEYDDHYDKTRAELAGDDEDTVGGLLGVAGVVATDDAVRQDVAEAVDEQRAWQEAHDAIRAADEGGSYNEAVDLAIDPVENGAAIRFDAVDEALGRAIDRTTTTFEQEVSEADGALTGTVAGVILLALVTAIGGAAGLWQRLKEYR
jgi:hypothetical protein